jgi:hypothetical protein
VGASRFGENQSAGGVDLGAAALLCVTAGDCDCVNNLSSDQGRSRSTSDLASRGC